MPESAVTGGCQCGAVRYRITAPLENPHICHCRMCQKAYGNYFAALFATRTDGLQWTRGKPSFFRSSALAQRGFCRDCGTPLLIADDGSDHVDMSIATLDHPEAVTPAHQYGIEGRLPAFALLHTLPGSRTEDDIPPEKMKRLKSLQHPDHETGA
ncbi:GFA family protein [Aestuariivirga sp.]|uniref:GFA family protein n=1 Tax=Aestuariivirga sp. TaxID=2650926 RepID=UPI00391A251C